MKVSTCGDISFRLIDIVELAAHPWNFHELQKAAVSRILIYPLNIRESLLINASNRHVTPLIPFKFLTIIPRGRQVSKKARRKNLPL